MERLELVLVLVERLVLLERLVLGQVQGLVQRPGQVQVVQVALAPRQLQDRRLPSPLWHLRFSPWRLS